MDVFETGQLRPANVHETCLGKVSSHLMPSCILEGKIYLSLNLLCGRIATFVLDIHPRSYTAEGPGRAKIRQQSEHLSDRISGYTTLI